MSDTTSQVLAYAPTRRTPHRKLLVLTCGLLTMALSIGAATWVQYQSRGEFSLWYLYFLFILPIGAFGLGVVASLGYAIGSKLFGCRIGRSDFKLILILALAAYLAGQYGVFKVARHTQGMSFLTYFDRSTRALRFESVKRVTDPPFDVYGRRAAEPATPLGVLGYGIRVLEFTAFLVGSLAAPLALSGMRYCDLCERYESRRMLALIPAASTEKKKIRFVVKAADLETDEDREAAAQANVSLQKMVECVEKGDAKALMDLVHQHLILKRGALPAPRVIAVEVSQCPTCGQGALRSGIQHDTKQQPSIMSNRIEFDSRFGKELASLVDPRR